MGLALSVDELPQAVGRDLGCTAWIEVSQDRIDQFAEATGDHQWIHVDVARAAAGPFGTTIAHGYLTLSLVSMLLPDLLTVKDASMGINYGTDKVRFPSPVPAGSRVRASGTITSVDEVDGGYQVVVSVAIAVEGAEKPACVAACVSRFLR